MDDYSRYKALESVLATTIKYVGTSFALIAADRQEYGLQDDVWSAIFDSSSLGGWLKAAEIVCKREKELPDGLKRYCREFNLYKEHPQLKRLNEICENMNQIAECLCRYGYDLQKQTSPNLIRALEFGVTVRNKCAHGALNSPFFSQIERPFLDMLKQLLYLIPFSKLVFWGSYGSNAFKFVEHPPKLFHRRCNRYFWAESELLSTKSTDSIPFMLYNQDARCIYFLNNQVSVDDPKGEYIEYGSGKVKYSEVRREWSRSSHPKRMIRPRNYQDHVNILRQSISWRHIKLNKAAIEAESKVTGIYVFSTKVALGACKVDVILYVGKTTDLADRMKAYLRIKGGYSDQRPEIAHMFKIYKENVQLYFSTVPKAKIAEIERAIYEVVMPEFNLITPPNTTPKGVS